MIIMIKIMIIIMIIWLFLLLISSPLKLEVTIFNILLHFILQLRLVIRA